jgi:tetratricopeptide (TPR) repeat protein
LPRRDSRRSLLSRDSQAGQQLSWSVPSARRGLCLAAVTSPIREQLQATLGSAYTLERELGGGGMSRVFVAEEHRLHRKVVVKVLSPELAQGLSVERFDREIQTAAALQQANIVPVLSAGETNGLPFYTMPFVEGESLRARLGRGPLPISEVIGIMRDVSKALAYAHRQGVVHRDIKPDNVLLSEGTAVVTDFGIAKAISAARRDVAAPTLTQIGTSIGTPAYMAPEQAAGDPDVDHRVDIYALGAMAYELLAGQAVFAGRTPQRMLAAHMSEAPKPVAELRPDIPTPLAELVMTCLEKDPAARPQAASDIARTLESITSGSGMQAMPPVLLGGPGMFRKALAIYAAAFVAVALLAKAAIVVIGLPDWVYPGTLVVMALGLPVVLVTGYVQHVTRRAMAATPTYTPGGTLVTTRGTIATMALKAAPHVSWYRTARGGMYAMGVFIVLIAAAMTMRVLGVGPFGTLFAAGRLNQRDPILFTDFRTTNTDTSLGRVVSDAVRAGLTGSSAFTLTSPATIVTTLQQMRLPPTTHVDTAVARQIALRQSIKAIVDGEVTGVPGGYIVTLRLVRADSGVELASFRETGDGPRGLIDAADKLARALRSKAGESLRAINETPPLFQATTSSLEALQLYSEAVRLNAQGDPRAIAVGRHAVAVDSTFAAAWSGLAAALSNYDAPRSAVDSAVTQAYRYRDRVSQRERELIVARYFGLGPGRDRSRSIAAMDAILQRGDTTPSILVNLGEMYRAQRAVAHAESLNLAAIRIQQDQGTPYGNLIELQLDQGKVSDAEAMMKPLAVHAPVYAIARQAYVAYARGDTAAVRHFVDSLRPLSARVARHFSRDIGLSLALLGGRLHEAESLSLEPDSVGGPPPADASFGRVWAETALLGPSPARLTQAETAIANAGFARLALVDRPYLNAAVLLARAGSPAKARAMLGRYRGEMTDTSIRRVQQAELHNALAEIALAEQRPQDALTEFRQGDVGFDGQPASECGPCLPYNLARAFDAAGERDSAIVMYERYLSTPYWSKLDAPLDPIRVPQIRERLAQLYDAEGQSEKAARNYQAFIDLWKNADPELQPRVRAARERLRRMSLDAPR